MSTVTPNHLAFITGTDRLVAVDGWVVLQHCSYRYEVWDIKKKNHLHYIQYTRVVLRNLLLMMHYPRWEFPIASLHNQRSAHLCLPSDTPDAYTLANRWWAHMVEGCSACSGFMGTGTSLCQRGYPSDFGLFWLVFTSVLVWVFMLRNDLKH